MVSCNDNDCLWMEYEWDWYLVFHDYNDCNHGGMNAILENAHHKNDNNYNIEMAIVTYNECINFNIIRQSRTIVHNHNDNNNY